MVPSLRGGGLMKVAVAFLTRPCGQGMRFESTREIGLAGNRASDEKVDYMTIIAVWGV